MLFKESSYCGHSPTLGCFPLSYVATIPPPPHCPAPTSKDMTVSCPRTCSQTTVLPPWLLQAHSGSCLPSRFSSGLSHLCRKVCVTEFRNRRLSWGRKEVLHLNVPFFSGTFSPGQHKQKDFHHLRSYLTRMKNKTCLSSRTSEMQWGIWGLEGGSPAVGEPMRDMT